MILLAAVRRTPRSKSTYLTTTLHQRRLSPTSLSKTSVTSSPLGRPPNATPSARHTPCPRCLQTIAPRRATRSPGKTRMHRRICDSSKPPSTRPTRPLPCAPVAPNTTVSPRRKPRIAPHPPFRTPLRLRSATPFRTRRRLDRCRRGRTPMARCTEPSLSTLSLRGRIRPLRRLRRRNIRRRV